MIAVVPVRGADLPAGAAETVAEAGGRVILVGDRPGDAAAQLPVADVVVADTGPFAPGRIAVLLAATLAAEDVVLLPASPDGRDLAPRLAAALGRPLLAGAVAVSPGRVVVARLGGQIADEYHPDGPVVATLEPGVRGVDPDPSAAPPTVRHLDLRDAPAEASDVPDADVLEVTAPDPTSMDLSEAPRIIAGGAGLGDAVRFALLGAVATALGASLGATRVVTDAGWVGHERQIGTTGVTVDPEVYVAFGISGAVQHTGGLGHPGHIIAVNLDPSCPMMTLADLAIVADAGAVVEALARRLAVDVAVPGPPEHPGG